MLESQQIIGRLGCGRSGSFLDKEFMDVAMRLNPKDKMAGNGKIEKYILRKAFEDYLPQEVAWRQKEQFSDGVGYNWIDSLKQVTSEMVTDDELKNAQYRFPINTPTTKKKNITTAVSSTVIFLVMKQRNAFRLKPV